MLQRSLAQGVHIALLGVNFFFPLTAFSESAHPPLVANEEVQRFADTLTLIKNYYVSPVKDHMLFNKAISGILNGLDPQSDIVEISAIKGGAQGQVKPMDAANIGLEVSIKDDVLAVVTPRFGSQAFKAGILPGDYIIKIGSRSTQGMSVEEATHYLQGKEGEVVSLVVLRKGLPKPLFFTIAYEKMPLSSVTSRLIDKQFAYVRISHFLKNTSQDVNDAIVALKKQAGHLKGLILDLRFNPGGELESAIHVADAFLDNIKKNPNMLIVKTQGRIPDFQYRATASPGDVLEKAPMVVLINQGSAFGAEIVAGALKDNQRAITLGQLSAGKGSVQTLIPLDEKSSLKLTTALYTTPKGIQIQDRGIAPDMVVEAINIPKDVRANMALEMNENNLKDHLASGNEPPKGEEKQEPTQALDDLLHEDYQLFTAMNILKGTMLTRGVK